jgi:hypothetical protein
MFTMTGRIPTPWTFPTLACSPTSPTKKRKPPKNWRWITTKTTRITIIELKYSLQNPFRKINGAPVITANWKAESSQRWTVPVGGGKIFHLGNLPQALSINSDMQRGSSSRIQNNIPGCAGTSDGTTGNQCLIIQWK